MSSRSSVGWASICALTASIIFSPITSNAETIASKGASHNGAYLSATKTAAAGEGIIITLELECRKNWGGTSAGAAFVQIVGVETGKYEQLDMKCAVNGGADGATKTSKTTNGLFLQGAQNAVIIGTMNRQSKSNWDVWQNSIESTVKGKIDQLIDATTDPKKLVEGATGAGLIGTFL